MSDFFQRKQYQLERITNARGNSEIKIKTNWDKRWRMSCAEPKINEAHLNLITLDEDVLEFKRKGSSRRNYI
jgi:hypothetical protein